jgi:antitoxin ParD1/3/4
MSRLTNGKDCHTVKSSPDKKEIVMATMNISLPDQMKAWVEECVQSGRYANCSDYVRDLIRRDHLKLEELRKALIEGENSGPSADLDIEAFIADKKKPLSA